MDADLQKILDLQLIYRRSKTGECVADSNHGDVVCDWQLKVMVPTDVAKQLAQGFVLPDTMLLQRSDLEFTGYTLGKEGMSSKYCPYCPLTKVQWMLPVGQRLIVEPWTLDKMREIFYDD